MRKRIISGIVLLITATGLFAQASLGSANYNDMRNYNKQYSEPIVTAAAPSGKDVSITVNGLMNIVADNYVAVFNLVQIGESLEEIDKLMNERIDTFRDELHKLGIAGESVKTDLVSFVPRYDVQTESKLFSKSYNEVPSGYEMQKNVSVDYSKSSQLDIIMSSALRAEIYDIVKVDYFIRDIELLRDSLRNECVREMKRKTHAFEQLGMKISDMDVMINDAFYNLQPSERYFSYQSYARPSFNAAKKRQNLNEAPKVVSRYYNQQDYSGYSVVINPVVNEPVIQLSYSITARYTKKENEDTEYFVITPSGDLRQLELKK